MHLCNYPIFVEDLDSEYIKKMMRNTPPYLYEKKSYKPYKMGVITDIHLDLQYKENTSSVCHFTMCCRDQEAPIVTNLTRAGKFGHLGQWCSIPSITFTSALESLKDKNASFILWLGDTFPADIFNIDHYQIFNVLNYATKALQLLFPSKEQIFPLIGNHESAPINQFDPFSDREHDFLNQLGDIWKIWLDEDSIIRFKSTGCYSYYFKDKNLRIIAFQTQVFDSSNSYLWPNPTDPIGTLKWINYTLSLAEMNNEDVIIIGHNVPNLQNAVSHWTLRYNSIVERYSNIIKGLYYGHKHQDYFYQMKSLFDGHVYKVTFSNPSLTTFGNVNPAYRIYEIDKMTNSPINHYTYRLYIDEANQKGIAEWKLAYEFLHEYNVTEITPESIEKIISRMWSDYEVYKRMLYIYYGEFISSESKEYISNSSVGIRCLFNESDPVSLWNCLLNNKQKIMKKLVYKSLQSIIFRKWGSIYFG